MGGADHPESGLQVTAMGNAELKELLHGAIDMHVHSIPSHFPRLMDDIDLAESLVKAGMGGAVVKFHGGGTAARAYLTNKHMGCEVLFGSITLNDFVGGINPVAVEAELLLGARVVWFPTIHSMNHIRFYGGSEWKNIKAKRSLPPPKRELTAFGEDGRLLPEVGEVLDVAAKYDVCVATGHLSIGESVALCREALRRGVKKIVLTHVDFETQKVPLELQAELAEEGVMIEKTALAVKWGHIGIEETARSIVHLGPEHCVLATDYGQADNVAIPEGLAGFLLSLLENGVEQDALEAMIKLNPRKMLGLK
jgi:hypothetical protein